MFALVEVRLLLNDYGLVFPRISANAVPATAYPLLVVGAVDLLYLVLILHTVREEGKDMCAAMRVSFKRFRDYWGFWNSLDWISIVLGFVTCALWFTCVLAMRSKSLSDLVDDGRLAVDVMELDTATLREIHHDVHFVNRCFLAMHLCAAFISAVTVMKFFKAFRANLRLNVVTMTLVDAAEDLFHLFIVVATVFGCFAIIGHVLFGCDIVEFATIGSSLKTSFSSLLGEIDWYIEWEVAGNFLPSGIPTLFLTMWFFAFMILVLLVMLNMLLGIILEVYAEQTMQIRGKRDAPSIWLQSARFLLRWLQTRGHVPLGHINHMLADQVAPAHPEEAVTTESLLRAFPEMKADQAQWLMSYLQGEMGTRAKEETERNMESYTQNIWTAVSEELRQISLRVDGCTTRLSKLEARLAPATDPVPTCGGGEGPDVGGEKPDAGVKTTTKGGFRDLLAEQRRTIGELVAAVRDLQEVSGGAPSAMSNTATV
eukprot:gnl/TRDRNA2_/TRDRNA2_155398_c3_seq2.p1 gnl/TRDRNA2_/TRDRNA2_155398_c3~~gnl/TRDRNA2_/TRDRNA2_155398_c3_seq2.p1  ORF type:complete len:499 (+),score=57.72 gnl/TRDRNA2_/TRDRNA2_155398_c3_seq2:45-1499(+)